MVNVPFPPKPNSRHFFHSLFRMFEPRPTPSPNGPTEPTYGFPPPTPPSWPSADPPGRTVAPGALFFAASLARRFSKSCVDAERCGSRFARGGCVASCRRNRGAKTRERYLFGVASARSSVRGLSAIVIFHAEEGWALQLGYSKWWNEPELILNQEMLLSPTICFRYLLT